MRSVISVVSVTMSLLLITMASSVASTRIVAMGDSTTAGTPGFKSPVEAAPNGRGDETSQYAYWLMQAHPDWEVLNRGVNGERSDQIRARFDRDVIAADPKAVVIIAGVNDVYQGRSVEHVAAQLHAMYARAAQAGIRVVAGSIIPYNTATPEQNARMRQINQWIRDQPLVELLREREQEHHERLLLVWLDLQHVLADALGLLRLVQQTVAFGLLEGPWNGFRRERLQLHHVLPPRKSRR
jgi:lysophospholipase L1-like esterase